MKSAKEVSFPIYPHLKKFIYQFYSIPKDQMVRVTMRTSMGIAMKHLLREKKKANLKEVERYTDRLCLLLVGEFEDLECRPSFIANFNIHYDRIFKEKLCIWVIAQHEVAIPASRSIKNFLEHFNIKESEYSYETAQRHWLRFRNEFKNHA